MWSLQDAKNRFSAVVDAALEGTPQEVTRRGKPAVVVLSTLEYRRLLAQAEAVVDEALGDVDAGVAARERRGAAGEGPRVRALPLRGAALPE